MTTETDDRGRLYLPKELRERHGERFRVVDLPSRIVLVPVDDDPLEAVREAVGDSFEGRSIAELKREARAEARKEVETEISEREERRKAVESDEEAS
jgi:bifunctional DNA-binding transcriptional regulator/antitoxin component of YhaV-PrlF toxin-antitoxin module